MIPGASELARPIRVRAVPERFSLDTSEAERAGLARRFSVTAIPALSGTLSLQQTEEGIAVHGTLEGEIVQPCAVTREDFAYAFREPVALIFVPEGQLTQYDESEEIELDPAAPDELEYEGESFDLGEALAQTLGLAIDPYREGPNADAARNEAGIESDEEFDAAPKGPLAEALAGLRKG